MLRMNKLFPIHRFKAPRPTKEGADLNGVGLHGAPADQTPEQQVLGEIRTLRRSVSGMLMAIFLLLSVGLIAVYSAAVNLPTRAVGTFTNAPLIAQAVRVVLCVLFIFAAARIRTEWLKKHSVAFLAVALGLLTLVWIPGLGEKILGARRWISIGGASFQPSELAKLCFLIYLSAFLARARQDGSEAPARELKFRAIAPALVALGLMVLLVLSEPDLGTTAILVGVSFCLLVVAGVRPLRLMIFGSVLVGAIAYYAHDKLDYVSRRFETFLDPPANTQVWHSIHAIGSGGIFGKGLGAGLQKLHFVPQSTSDFIVAVIGEEGGFFALTFVVALYASVVVCGLQLILRIKDRFAQL